MTIRVGIVGCGKIADEHADAIRYVPDVEICGVCDTEELMARQLAERYQVQQYFSDAAEMLAKAKPLVVHITTPPQSHYRLARMCLETGSHVFLEKPFTVTATEAKELIGLASERKLKLTVGHNHQHSVVATEMRDLISKGFLGGPPIYMESTFSQDLGSDYTMAFLGDKTHWVRALPGKLMHNVISHGVCKIAEYLSGEQPQVKVHGQVSRPLRDRAEFEIIDELRAIIWDEEGTTAYFTFSSQIKPGRHEFRVFGPKNFLLADHSHQVLIKGMTRSYKSYLNNFVPPFLYGMQHIANGARNVRRFIRNQFHADLGRRCLIRGFYSSITNGTPLPISTREILLTARIMDAIFAQLSPPAVQDTLEEMEPEFVESLSPGARHGH
jgi:predicted dehydrogenase